MPGMYISFWHGLWMPRGVPKDVLAAYQKAEIDKWWSIIKARGIKAQ